MKSYGFFICLDFRQIAKARLLGKFQQALYPIRLMLKMQCRNELSLEGCLIGHALILFQTANLRIAISNLNGEFALCEFFALAQIFEQIAKGGKLLW